MTTLSLEKELLAIKNRMRISNFLILDMLNYSTYINDTPLLEYLTSNNKTDEYNYILSLLKRNLTVSDLSLLQKILCKDKNVQLGYRKRFVHIQSKTTKEIAQVISVYDFNKELDNLLNYFYNGKEKIFSRLALFHLFFEDIHPFADGNGTVGRFILNLELLKNGYAIFKKNNSKLYYDSFKEWRLNKNAKLMKECLLKEVYDNMNDLEKYLIINKYKK